MGEDKLTESAPTDRRTKRAVTKGERTRARILAVATELFSEYGSHAVSLRDIAAKAKISHVGLLHHFANKDTLLLEVLNQRDVQLLPSLNRPEGNASSPITQDPDRVMIVFAGIIHSVRRNAQARTLVSLFSRISAESTDPEQPAHTHFQHRYRYLLDLITTAFETRFTQVPPPHPVRPAVAAQQIVALMDGLQVQWLLATSSTQSVDKVEAFEMAEGVEAFLASLGIVPSEADFEALQAHVDTGTPMTPPT